MRWSLPAALLLAGCAAESRHLRNIRQLTFGGTHAEAYFNHDGTRLILQATREGDADDQIYLLDPQTGKMERVSHGGKTTCAWFLPDGRYFYSSTHHHGRAPPPPPDRSKGYVWALHRTFDIFLQDGPRLVQLTDSDGYDAEGTASRDGRRIVFTSHREGSIGLYTINSDGSDLRKVSHRRGYAGGAVFTADGEWLVHRAFYPRTPAEQEEFDRLLQERLLRPVNLEIYMCRPDGSDERALTANGRVNFAPFPFPDGRKVIFVSDLAAARRGHYALFTVGSDGRGLKQITFREGFDGFPCVSPDGKRLVWISDRNATRPRELNVFIADWAD
jgi:Tol biopolymer transport system component